jgi:hypothetical protein
MQHLSRIAPWVNRLVLAVSTLLFTMISLRYIADPVRASAARGATLGSPLAATTTRVGFGAFPLAFAIFSLVCLLSRRRVVAGISLVAIVMTTAILVRLVSIAADGAIPQSTRLFIPETVILLLSLGGLMMEAARRRAQPAEGA